MALAVVVSTVLTAAVGALLVRGFVRDRVLDNLDAQARAAQRVLNRPAGATRPVEQGLFGFFREQDEFLGLPGRAVPGLRLRDAMLREAGGRTSGELTVGRFHVLFVSDTTARGRFVLARRAGLGVDDWKPFAGGLVLAGLAGGAVAALVSLLLARSITGPVREVAAASGEVAAGHLETRVPVRGHDELAELATSFNSMADQLAASRDRDRAFLLSVSHELKTPLTAIRGYAEALRERAVGPEDAAGVIGAESERLERLVRDLLDLARLDRRGFTVHREAVDLAAVAGEAARRHSAQAEQFGVSLSVDAIPAATATADAGRLLQVVSNLVENAIRVTPAGGEVRIRVRPGLVTVADTGPGLAPEDLPRAFERFYLHGRYGADRPVGSGLGLAIVKELTEAMGGTVSAHGEPGAGAEFMVDLPPAPQPQAAHAPPQATPPPPAEAG